MSIVNLNITFVKKQKQTRPTPNAQLKDGARHSFITRNGRFHTKDGLFVWDGLSVWWFASDICNWNCFNFEWTIRLTLSVNLTESLKMDYPFHWEPLYSRPSPHNKSEKGCLWGRGRLASLKRIIHISTSLKINGTNLGNKFFYG